MNSEAIRAIFTLTGIVTPVVGVAALTHKDNYLNFSDWFKTITGIKEQIEYAEDIKKVEAPSEAPSAEDLVLPPIPVIVDDDEDEDKDVADPTQTSTDNIAEKSTQVDSEKSKNKKNKPEKTQMKKEELVELIEKIKKVWISKATIEKNSLKQAKFLLGVAALDTVAKNVIAMQKDVITVKTPSKPSIK